MVGHMHSCGITGTLIGITKRNATANGVMEGNSFKTRSSVNAIPFLVEVFPTISSWKLVSWSFYSVDQYFPILRGWYNRCSDVFDLDIENHEEV